ncbi:MAG: Glycosyltransferase Gtf1, partial [Alphaproteobacteria bacterium MarineAlpha2_Bin1]
VLNNLNIISLTRDSVKITKKINTRKFLNDFFGHPGFKLTYVLNINNKNNNIITLGKNIIGIDKCINLNPFISEKFFISHLILFELYSIFVTLSFIKKTKTNFIELVTPGPIELRAIIIKFITNCHILAQVRGNVDLLSHSMDKYFYFRLSRKIFLVRILSLFIHKLVSEIFYSNCSLVIGYNKNNLDSAISNGANPKITRLLRIEIHEQNQKEQNNISNELNDFPNSSKIILIWSRLSKEKLINEIIKGFLIAADKINDLNLVIIGSGPEEENLKKIAELSKHSSQIHFLGYKNRNYISHASKRSLFTIISFGGSTLVEAALLKLPIIAFDIEWHSELIRNDETGYLVDYSDSYHLSEAIIKSVKHNDKLKAMSENCYLSVKKMFNYSNYFDNKKRYMKILINKIEH